MSFWKKRLKKAKADAADSGTQGNPVQNDAVDWQARYNAEHEAFLQYRSEIASADERRRRTEAYGALLGECGIPEKYRGRLTVLCDIDRISLDDEGKIVGAEEIAASVREDWSELIPASAVPVANPPMYRGQAMTREQIMAIRDRDARRAAILENLELFQV